jgi:hypothetical protein
VVTGGRIAVTGGRIAVTGGRIAVTGGRIAVGAGRVGTGRGGIKGIMGIKPARPPIPIKDITGGAARVAMKPKGVVGTEGTPPSVDGVGGVKVMKPGTVVPAGPIIALPNQPVKPGEVGGVPNQPPKGGRAGMIPVMPNPPQAGTPNPPQAGTPKPPQVGTPKPPQVGTVGIQVGVVVPGTGGMPKYITGLKAPGMISCACAFRDVNRLKLIAKTKATNNTLRVDTFFIKSPF